MGSLKSIAEIRCDKWTFLWMEGRKVFPQILC